MTVYPPRNPNVFIVGSKGIPARYGGFETFVDKLTKYSSERINFHVACRYAGKKIFFCHGARCISFYPPPIGPAKAIWYDCSALKHFIAYCRKHPEIEHPIFYVLACRIGFAIHWYSRQIHRLGGVLYVNPDGHEWKRKRWSWPVRLYWRYSESRMVRRADRVICDSKVIESYICEKYAAFRPRTQYIPYGAEKETTDKEKLDQWLERHDLKRKEYYILVGRFVQENNFEHIIREFMASGTVRKLVIVTGNNSRLRARIERTTGYQSDPRICFVGTVYDSKLLCGIRENAFASFHGHEVGGTNPSLLEGLCCTNVNLVLDVPFNREICGDDCALYWTKERDCLSALIDRAEQMDDTARFHLGEKAAFRIREKYRWEEVAASYGTLFEGESVSHEKETHGIR